MEDHLFSCSEGIICGNKIIKLSYNVRRLIKYMDGRTSDDELRELARVKFGFKLSRKAFKRLAYKLEEFKLLAGRDRGCLLSKFEFVYLEKVNNGQRIRRPLYAGYCYPDRAEELRAKLKWCFSFINHTRLRFFYKNIKKLRGVIVPHSNLEISGPCAAWAYKMIEKRPLPDLFIIFAPDHSEYVEVPYTVLLKDFYTPLGLVKVDKDIGRGLANKCGFDIFAYNAAHIREHAIELQLPFLQYIYKRQMSKIRILPVLCATNKFCPENFELWAGQFMKAIRELIMLRNKEVMLIATGDLNHARDISSNVMFHNKNQRLIALLKNGDAENLKANWRYTACCKRPAHTLLKVLSAGRGTVLNYSWSLNPKFINNNRLELQYFDFTNIGFASIIY
jgi:AmmeMemoRadiSam system protein B